MVRRLSNEEIQRRILEAQQRRRQSLQGDEMTTGAAFFFQGDEKPDPAVEPDLSSIINVEELQSIMNDFHSLTVMVTAILDLRGNIIEATGWQDICTRFHRMHPATLANCTESEHYQMIRLEEGEYFDYRCKNGHMGCESLRSRHPGAASGKCFLRASFFMDDDVVDEDFFIRQARLLRRSTGRSIWSALHRVPRRRPGERRVV